MPKRLSCDLGVAASLSRGSDRSVCVVSRSVQHMQLFFSLVHCVHPPASPVLSMATSVTETAPVAAAQAPSAPATPSMEGPGPATAVLDAITPPARKRARAPRIDIDAAILKHMDEIKQASKMVNEARRAARNERRRKSRLMKKAATLTPEDLERIAVLKRCGLYNPTGELVIAATSSAIGATSSPSSVQTTAITAAAPLAQTSPKDRSDDDENTEEEEEK